MAVLSLSSLPFYVMMTCWALADWTSDVHEMLLIKGEI